jgi:beta-lactamase superfamily II metal-dependent hydrolase
LGALAASVLSFVTFGGPAAAKSALAIYFIDVEGGQSTLIVTPSGEALLVDAGFPADGTFASKPGNPHASRDARRIASVAREAGLKQIDYLLITHFHGDHDGGVVELSQLVPIRTFIDHDTVLPEAEAVAGTLDLFQRYAAVRAKGRHIVSKPGDRLPLNRIDATIVSSGREILSKPLAGAGSANAACSASSPVEQEVIENPRSTGLLLRFGRFRFLDVGDLVSAPLRALFCPVDRIGPVDAYLVTHHGNADAADRATFAALKPRTAIVNNGAMKGGAPELLGMLQELKIDSWQLHRSTNPASRNADAARVANLDETTANWIRLDANEDGSFAVTNGRTGQPARYPSMRH